MTIHLKSLASCEVKKDPIPTLDAELSYIKRKFPDHIDPAILTFIDFDIEVSTSKGRLTTANIIAEITGTQDEKFKLMMKMTRTRINSLDQQPSGSVR